MSFRSVKGSKKADKRFYGYEKVEKIPGLVVFIISKTNLYLIKSHIGWY